LLSACSSDDFDLEIIYGTWVEPFDQSKSITFRENGTVDWLGEEGTFEADTWEPRNSACSALFCFDKHGIKVTLPSTTLKFVPRTDEYDGAWHLDGDCGRPYQEHLYLYRKGTLPQPLMPEPFEKLGEGWSLPDTHTRSNWYEITSSDPLIAADRGQSWIYNDTTDTWKKYSSEEDIIGNKLYLKYPNADGYGYDVSLDQGQTWKTLPPLVGESWVKLTETTVVALIELPANQHELWTIDAAAESPTWTLRKSLNAESKPKPKLLVHPTKGTIALVFQHRYSYDNEGNPRFDLSGSTISDDYGHTWKDFDYFPNDNSGGEARRRCESWSEFQFHAQGLLCNNGNAISWYDSITHTWSMHEVAHDEFIDSVEPGVGAYLRRGNQVLQWKPGATETLLVTLPSHLEFDNSPRGKIAVLDDQIIVNAFGLWRLWR
ncbi:MAG: hypothetical protein VX699_10015, partial [Myxococcota bacterium]|nr:hypothetical protein [Myxococcota bacterium]